MLALVQPNNAFIPAHPPEYTSDTKSYCGWWEKKGPWKIYTAGWGRHDNTSREGCGSDLLDSLTRECRPIYMADWGCEHPPESANDTEHGAVSTFKLAYVNFNTQWIDCVEQAIYEASGSKERVKCRDMGYDE